MVVPNIRNPNRHRTLEVAKATKSTYHQEPEFYRVARRTKGGGVGGGGGSVYSSGYYGSSNNGDDDEVHGVLIGLAFLVIVLLIIRYFVFLVHRHRSEQTSAAGNDTTPGASAIRFHGEPQTNAIPSRGDTPSGVIVNTCIPERHKVTKANFYYQSVFKDKSNIDPDFLSEKNDGDTLNDDEDSILEKGEAKSTSEQGRKRGGAICQLSSRCLMPAWRRPTAQDECSICLNSYDPGQTICLSRNPRCKHVFHQECIEEWLEDHSDCPLCRTNLIMY